MLTETIRASSSSAFFFIKQKYKNAVVNTQILDERKKGFPQGNKIKQQLNYCSLDKNAILFYNHRINLFMAMRRYYY